MSKLDQFASAFKSAAKAQYQHAPVTIDKVMVMTDLPVDGSRRFAKDVEEFLRVIGEKGSVEWQEHHVSPGEDVGALLEVIERCRPKLICCYRNLHGRARSFPFSLGAQVDVLTQATTTPVLLLPAPTSENRLVPGCVATNTVMVLTDHLTGSDRLIDYGVGFASDRGAKTTQHLSVTSPPSPRSPPSTRKSPVSRFSTNCSKSPRTTSNRYAGWCWSNSQG
jgi:hypothetical protein